MSNNMIILRQGTFYFVLFLIFFYMWYLNSSIPLQPGDDYRFLLRSEEGGVINVFQQYQEKYVTHNGRPGNLYNMFFLLDPTKTAFNIISSIFFLLFIIGIFILAVSRLPSPKNSSDIILITFIFTAIFVFHKQIDIRTTVFWHTGACNYLIPTTILLWVLIPFRFLISRKTIFRNNLNNAALAFFFGLLGGWTNENTVPAAFLLLSIIFLLYQFKHHLPLPRWFYTGAFGLLIGWLFIILSPGHAERLAKNIEKSQSLLIWLEQSYIDRVYQSLIINIDFFLAFRSKMWLLAVPFLIYSFTKSKKLPCTREYIFKPQIFFLLSVIMMFLSDWAYIYAMGKAAQTKVIFGGFAFFMMEFVSLVANFEWNRSKVVMHSILIGVVLYIFLSGLRISCLLVNASMILNNQNDRRVELLNRNKGKDLILEPYSITVYNSLIRDELYPVLSANEKYARYHGLTSVRIRQPLKEYSMSKNYFKGFLDIGNKNIVKEVHVYYENGYSKIVFIKTKNNKLRGKIHISSIYNRLLFLEKFTIKSTIPFWIIQNLSNLIYPYGNSILKKTEYFDYKDEKIYYSFLSDRTNTFIIYTKDNSTTKHMLLKIDLKDN